MTKDVLISLRGLQFDQSETDTEKIETITAGTYYEKNGKYYVLYDEVMEGFTETTKNKIKFGEHFLELSRSGLVNVHMLFEENKKNMTSYQTPYGNILIGIDTKKIHITQEPDRMLVNVDYALDINYEYLADCQIVMEVRSKGSAEKVLI